MTYIGDQVQQHSDIYSNVMEPFEVADFAGIFESTTATFTL